MLKVSPLFGDQGMLPAGKKIRIFGRADEGAVIRAQLTRTDGKTTGEGWCVGKAGRFLLHLPPQRVEDAPLTLVIASETERFVAEDLSVGLVFLAGGQSNMEWALENAAGGREMITSHDDPELRYFSVPRVSVLDEAGMAAHDAACWQKILPDQGGEMSAVAYFFARTIREKTGLPVGIVGCNWGGTSVLSWMDEVALNRSAPARKAAAAYEECIAGITLPMWQERQQAFEVEMNAWNARVAEVKAASPGLEWTEVEKRAGVCPWHPPAGPGSPYRPGQLHRTMVDRIVPMALSGVLFYQGESDVERAEDYGDLLITLVTRWRELFADAELPFCNVQLPMYIDAGAQDDRRWAILRYQQEKAWRTLQNSELAVMIDAGEYGNIHPVDKRTPGERLALAFLKLDHTPRAAGKSTCGKTLTVEVTQPVEIRGERAELFEIAGEDGVYYPAQAEVHECCIRLTAQGVQHPVKVRYAWVNWGRVQVFGKEVPRLPLAPFIMED